MSMTLDKPSSNSTPDLTNRLRILVVDDEQLNLEMLRSILQRDGYEPILAGSGEQALQCLAQTAPELVLLDVVMEPMDGFEVLRRIRESYSDTDLPVLMVTDDSDRRTAIKAFRGGANDYLTKPIDAELTLSRVSLHLRLRRAQIELQRSQERYRLAAEGSRIGLWEWESSHSQLFLSDRWKEMLGYAGDELQLDWQGLLDYIHPSDRQQLLDLLHRRRAGVHERFELEMRILHRDQSYRWMQCTGILQTDEAGNPKRLAGSLADVTDGKVRDALTGLPNRLLFDERIQQAARHKDRQSGFTSVLFLDLDKFKLINDSLGHDMGDQLLCHVARRLERCVHNAAQRVPGDLLTCIARRGGDEFTVLIENLPRREDAERIAQQIVASLCEPMQLGDHEVSVGVSIGIAFINSSSSSVVDTVREADTAMYYAKTAGRGGCCIYDPSMQTAATARLSLESDVRHAVKSRQFYVEYQPIVSLSNGSLDGFEALCRWNHPRQDSIGPDVFIPVLESLGLIGQLGDFVLTTAGQQIKAWNHALRRPRPLTLTVNYSTREFVRPEFRERFLKTITEVGLEPRMVRIEVTESALMSDPTAAGECVRSLRENGVTVGLDDFGTGYSSLSYLHRLPLDLLKIDKSFIQSMQPGNESFEIVRNIISLARSLGLDVVAEGVESKEQHNLLVQMNCSHAQGYLYSRPQRAEAITRQLTHISTLSAASSEPVGDTGTVLAEQDLNALFSAFQESLPIQQRGIKFVAEAFRL